MESGGQYQVVRLGSQCMYLLTHLVDPTYLFCMFRRTMDDDSWCFVVVLF